MSVSKCLTPNAKPGRNSGGDRETALSRRRATTDRPLRGRIEIANGKNVEPPDISILFLNYQSIGWVSSVKRWNCKYQP